MSDLRELYQEVILDHSKAPRNFGRLESPTHKAEGYNPLCGDKIRLYLELEGDTVKDARFEGSGCAISTASASLMTEALKGKSRTEVQRLFDAMHDLLTGNGDGGSGGAGGQGEGRPVDLGKLTVFAGVVEYPMRVKCATLAWHTMQNALQSRNDGVATTE